MPNEVEFTHNDAVVDDIFDDLEWQGIIRYEAPYAIYIERDTSYADTKPPFDPIHEWVKRNWGELAQVLKDAAIEDRDPNSVSVAEHKRRVAWIVVDSIFESGHSGVYFAQRSIERGKRVAPKLAKRYENSDDPDATENIVRELIEEMFVFSQGIVEREANDTGELLDSGTTTIRPLEEGD